MRITKDELLYVAKLAKIEIQEQDFEKFLTQISNILEYVDMLETLDTKNVEPTYNTVLETNIFREDELAPSLGTEKALANAPKSEDGHFIVPKIIE